MATCCCGEIGPSPPTPVAPTQRPATSFASCGCQFNPWVQLSLSASLSRAPPAPELRGLIGGHDRLATPLPSRPPEVGSDCPFAAPAPFIDNGTRHSGGRSAPPRADRA